MQRDEDACGRKRLPMPMPMPKHKWNGRKHTYAASSIPYHLLSCGRVEEADTAADGMGICASCLGLNGHPSQDREIDRLLNSEQPNAAYGAVGHSTFAQPDEEELRREREALEHITAHAADHMIDVVHPSQSDLHYGMLLGGHRSYLRDPVEHSAAYQHSQHGRAQPETEDSEEAAWLESVQSAQLDTIQMPESGTLTIDIGLLRETRPPQRDPKHESAY
ncbi:hypothetical protein AC578_445 [Pseudocercospora eumusae]|uniref:Uncharacterized protein n=1 Tax=Pseudocercospora eumusae TaxID=321146 RepID=A0A139HY59_9PEZI|nr:hypothetical protein AC578_445 [Pseudocercospora eumusae]